MSIKQIDKLDKCPTCGEKLKYKVKGKEYSRIIGIEIRELYDGVSQWQCPFCKTRWDRWTGEEVK